MSELKRMAKLLNMPTTEGIRLGDVYTLASDKIEKLEAQLDASLPLIAELDLRVKAALRREEKLKTDLKDSKFWQNHWKNESSSAKAKLDAVLNAEIRTDWTGSKVNDLDTVQAALNGDDDE